ncbi:MAG: DNA repair protein RecN [Candidatus Adiutrix sp.]|nr:DNA repair protein RecN [Candidatus Adiutrix sp.]
MLAELSVKNLALIDELVIGFGAGANIMSGETGAGKSILAGALDILAGRRVSADFIRAGAEEAVVEALFVLDEPELLRPVFDGLGLKIKEELILRRLVSASGRGKAYVNGALVTRNQLGDLGGELLNISGQHDQQMLLKPACQLDYLDRFGRHGEMLGTMRRAWQEMSQAESALKTLADGLKEAVEKKDLFEFQRHEIEKAAPRANEDDELLAEKNSARNSAKLTEALEASAAALGGEPGNIVEKLSLVRRNLERGVAFDPNLEEALALAENCFHQLADLSVELDRRSRETGADSDRLEWIEERLNTLAKIKRKYGPTLAEVIERGRNLAAALDQLDNAELDLSRLRRQFSAACEAAAAAADQLHQARLKAGAKLADMLTKSLRPLGFPKIEMQIKVEAAAREDESACPGPRGWDAVEFLFCPNPGEGIKPLAKIASGGELSRVMLALKTVEGGAGDQLLVFDEIDSGLGGATAEAVAAKMGELALRQQVIVITHLPQMAALAGRHFLAAKTADQATGRTVTTITRLTPEERVKELARMLGGSNPSREAYILAEQLLAQNAAERTPAA